MSRSHLGGLAAAALVGAVFAAVPHSADAAATGGGQNARALAAQSAHRLIASKAPALKISAHDAFQAKPVQSSHGIQYAPYERTYRGLPVVGGDFVVVSDSARPDPRARPWPRPTRSTWRPPTPSLAKSTAVRHGAPPGAPRHRRAPRPHLVVWQHGTRSRLGWETRVTGHQGAMPSIKDVVVDARNGKVLQAKERVADGTGNSRRATAATRHHPDQPVRLDVLDDRPEPPDDQVPERRGNTTFTGPDDVWGNGVKTDRETGCVDAMYVENPRTRCCPPGTGGTASTAPAAAGRSGSASTTRTPTTTAPRCRSATTPRASGSRCSTCSATSRVTASTTTPRAGSPAAGTQEFVADTFGAATEWYANEPRLDTARLHRRREVNLVGSGPIRYMYNPSLAGDANCYSSSASRTRRSTRPPARATTGSTCWPRAAARPTVSPPARPATARR